MRSKAWMDMKWTDENYALTMPDMNAQQQDHEILEDVAHDQDLEIDDDQDHVIVEDLDHDQVEEVDDREVAQEDGVETEEADPSQIDLDHVTENQNLDHPSVTGVDHVDAIAVDHVTSKREKNLIEKLIIFQVPLTIWFKIKSSKSSSCLVSFLNPRANELLGFFSAQS